VGGVLDLAPHPLQIAVFGQDVGAIGLRMHGRVLEQIVVVTKRIFVEVGGPDERVNKFPILSAKIHLTNQKHFYLI
jgi:hypothetical protein